MRLNISELMRLAEITSLTDEDALRVLGQCILVLTLLDPGTAPALKEVVAKQLAGTMSRSECDIDAR